MSEEATTNRDLGRWATGIVALGGLVIAWYLTSMHVQARVGEAVGGSLCEIGGIFDCVGALDSAFSTLFGVPIAVIGQAFYVTVTAFVVFDRHKTRQGQRPYRPAAIITTTFLFGLVYSLFLASVSAFVVGSLCPFCTMLYVVNGLGLVAAAVWAGQGPVTVLKAQLSHLQAMANGWVAFFLIIFFGALLFGASVMETEVRNRQAAAPAMDAEQMPRIEEARYRDAQAPAKGPVDAPVHLVEFTNFTCPYCARLSGVLARLAEDYPDQLRIEFRHFPLQEESPAHLAARAAVCADEQDAFWPMHDALFAGDEIEQSELIGLAEGLNLETQAFSSCLDSDRAAARVDADMQAGNRLGIRGTPTAYLNGLQIAGARPYDTLKALIEDELNEAAQQEGRAGD